MARISYGSPAAITRCHSSGPRESRTNDTPFPANSQDAPNAWMSAPPTAGPIMTPALRPAASSPFTHLMSFSRRCETVAPGRRPERRLGNGGEKPSRQQQRRIVGERHRPEARRSVIDV